LAYGADVLAVSAAVDRSGLAMQLAFVNFFSIQYCIAVPPERVQYRGARRQLRLTAAIPLASNKRLEG